MSLSYEPLWKELKKRKMRKQDLLEQANLTTNVIASMGKNKYISLRNLEKICRTLNCTLDNVVSFSDSEGEIK